MSIVPPDESVQRLRAAVQNALAEEEQTLSTARPATADAPDVDIVPERVNRIAEELHRLRQNP
jgi:ubiquinone biosynthesis protein UbiJ